MDAMITRLEGATATAAEPTKAMLIHVTTELRKLEAATAGIVERAQVPVSEDPSIQAFVGQLDIISEFAGEPLKIWLEGIGKALLFLGEVMDMAPPQQEMPESSEVAESIEPDHMLPPGRPFPAQSSGKVFTKQHSHEQPADNDSKLPSTSLEDGELRETARWTPHDHQAALLAVPPALRRGSERQRHDTPVHYGDTSNGEASKCFQCDLEFASVKKLKWHLSMVHKRDWLDDERSHPPAEKNYVPPWHYELPAYAGIVGARASVCFHCGLDIPTQTQLRNHLVHEHGDYSDPTSHASR